MRIIADGDVIMHPNYGRDYVTISVEICYNTISIVTEANINVFNTSTILEDMSIKKEFVIKQIWASLFEEKVKFVYSNVKNSYCFCNLFSLSDVSCLRLRDVTLNYHSDNNYFTNEIQLRWESD